MTKKLTQISRISEKSLLCNALINTHPHDWAPWVGSAISDGTLPLPLHHAAVHNAPDVRWSIYIICKIRGVSTGGCKCLSKHPNPTLGRIRKDVFIKNQSSKAISLFEIRKWQDNFLVTVHGFLMHWQAKCHCKQPDIRNIMGIHQFEVWEVLVIKK